MPIPAGIYPPFAAFELWSGRDGNFDASGIRTYTRVFGVFTDVPARGPLSVWLITGLPRYGDFYVSGTDFDRAATLRSMKPSQDPEDACLWKLVCRYSNEPRPRKWPEKPKSPSDSSDSSDPKQRPPVTKYRTVRYQVPVGYDDPTGLSAIRNSAGDPVSPAPMKDTFYLKIVYTRNVLTISPSIVQDYMTKLNDAPFNGFPIFTVRLADWAADQMWETGYQYWTEVYEFEARIRTKHQQDKALSPWRLWLIDQGLHQIAANGTLDHIYVTNSASPVSQPVPLDGHGKPLPPGAAHVTIKGLEAEDGGPGPVDGIVLYQSILSDATGADFNNLKITFGT